MGDLVVVVPMLGRPHRVLPLLASLDETAPDARILFALSPHDHEVLKAVAKAGREHIAVPHQRGGDYQRKINAGIRTTAEPLIFTAADDLRFHPGWVQAARAKLRPGIGVVGTNDLCSPRVIRGEHATHMLVTRDYVERHGTIDEPGKFFHEGYPHEWCDDEAVETAKKRNAWAFAADSIVEHLHPMAGKAPTDALYAQQPIRLVQGRRLYKRRRRLWT